MCTQMSPKTLCLPDLLLSVRKILKVQSDTHTLRTFYPEYSARTKQQMKVTIVCSRTSLIPIVDEKRNKQ